MRIIRFRSNNLINGQFKKVQHIKTTQKVKVIMNNMSRTWTRQRWRDKYELQSVWITKRRTNDKYGRGYVQTSKHVGLRAPKCLHTYVALHFRTFRWCAACRDTNANGDGHFCVGLQGNGNQSFGEPGDQPICQSPKAYYAFIVGVNRIRGVRHRRRRRP